MTEHGRLLLVTLLVVASVGLIAIGPPHPTPLGPAEPELRCQVPIERVAEGVVCLDEQEAERAGLVAGDRVAADGGVGRMAPERIELFAVPIDVNGASVEELAALPGVGPGLAARIAEARPIASLSALRDVPGIGAKRFLAIAPRVRLGPRPR